MSSYRTGKKNFGTGAVPSCLYDRCGIRANTHRPKVGAGFRKLLTLAPYLRRCPSLSSTSQGCARAVRHSREHILRISPPLSFPLTHTSVAQELLHEAENTFASYLPQESLSPSLTVNKVNKPCSSFSSSYMSGLRKSSSRRCRAS